MNLRISALLSFALLGAGAAYAADSSKQEYDQTFVYCRDVEWYMVTPPEWKRPQAPQEISSDNSFSPLPDALLRRLKIKGNVISPTTIQQMGLSVATLRSPSHGKVKDLTPPDKQYENHLPGGKTVLLPLGTTSYHYTFMPDLGYLGKDQVFYEVHAQGKRYKVIVNFMVVSAINDSGPPQCSSEKFSH